MSDRRCMAQVDQGFSNDLDLCMTDHVRRRLPRARWWWGRRNWHVVPDTAIVYPPGIAPPADVPVGTRFGAWCYLCSQPIVDWSSRWPMTDAAKMAVADHRLTHIQARLDAGPTQESDQ